MQNKFYQKESYFTSKKIILMIVPLLRAIQLKCWRRNVAGQKDSFQNYFMTAEPPGISNHWQPLPRLKPDKIIKIRNSIKLSLMVIAILTIILNGIFNSSYAGDAVLSWTPPTTNYDGTPLTTLAGYKVYYGTSPGTYSSSLDVRNITTFDVTDLTENITYFFTVTAYDRAGNESSYSNEVNKTIPIPGLVSPMGTVSINNGATYTNSSTVTLTLSCSANGPGCSRMQFSEDNIRWGVWNPYSSNKTYTFSSGEGTKTIYVKFQDNAGNNSISSSDSIIIDKTPPSGALSINNGAILGASSWVTLMPSCSDNLSDCSRMRFSNDDSTWSSWEVYSNRRLWKLPNGDGNKAVYVLYKDNAGNFS
ncbi:MAG: fibronectin type III domain-containing protein, partial [Nitrospira sp.]|nr:fibronectin type III domain-containing protein [Nitrospira sp.]